MAENKLISLADLNGDNGTEFLEKCVNNWNSWVELTSTLKEVEEKNEEVANKEVTQMCEKLLANLIIEDYKINKL